MKEKKSINIDKRMLFGENLARQPAFLDLLKNRPEGIRISNDPKGLDYIMNNILFLGTYPGLTKEMLDEEIKVIINFVKDKKN